MFTEEDLYPEEEEDKQHSLVSKSSASIGVIVGVILGSILLISIGFVYYKYYKKALLKKQMFQIQGDLSKLPQENPSPDHLELESQKSKSNLNHNKHQEEHHSNVPHEDHHLNVPHNDNNFDNRSQVSSNLDKSHQLANE